MIGTNYSQILQAGSETHFLVTLIRHWPLEMKVKVGTIYNNTITALIMMHTKIQICQFLSLFSVTGKKYLKNNLKYETQTLFIKMWLTGKLNKIVQFIRTFNSHLCSALRLKWLGALVTVFFWKIYYIFLNAYLIVCLS